MTHTKRWAVAALLLAAGCETAQERVLRGLRGPDPAARCETLARMRTYMREEMPPALLEAVLRAAREDPDLAARYCAIRSLGEHVDADACRDMLLTLAQEPDAAVRREAVAALARCRSPGVGRALEQRFHSDADPQVRATALAALTFAEPRRHQTLVLTALQDDRPSIRHAALRICYRYRIQVDVALLDRLARDADPATSRLAQRVRRAQQTSSPASEPLDTELDAGRYNRTVQPRSRFTSLGSAYP